MANKTVELWCENGQHKWKRESKRGRRPLHCPEHQPVIEHNGEPGAGLERARLVRREKADIEVWAYVERSIETNHCKCGLEPNMTRDDLDAIKPSWGCTDGRYVCPSLDTYRRLLPNKALPPSEQALIEEAVI